MIQSSVANTKNNLSALLQRVKEGETVEITERGKPIARIAPLPAPDVDEHIQEMIRKGEIRPPLRKLCPGDIKPIELENRGYAGAVDALLQERSEGW